MCCFRLCVFFFDLFFSILSEVYYLLLLVYVTPKIPVDHLLSEHYLPSVLLLRFFHDQWKHAEQYGRLIGQREDDPDFSLMMNSLEVASRVALREYPWVKVKKKSWACWCCC
jgi:hypothetical protein